MDSARPYPAGFEMSGWVWNDGPGIERPGGLTEAVLRRFLPDGFSIPAGSTQNPPGWSETRLRVAPAKSLANGVTAVRFDLLIRQHNLQIKFNPRFHSANQIAI